LRRRRENPGGEKIAAPRPWAAHYRHLLCQPRGCAPPERALSYGIIRPPALQDFPPFIYRIYPMYFLPLYVLPLVPQKRMTWTPRQDAYEPIVPSSVLLVECGTTLR